MVTGLKTSLIASLVFAVFSFSAVILVSAQAGDEPEVGASFVVSPAKQEVVLNPGESVNRDIRVTNTSENLTTFSLTLEDLIGSDNPEQAVTLLGDDVGPYSLRETVQLSESQITVAPGETRSVSVNISAPANLSPGGRYGAVVISNAPSQLEGEQTQSSGATLVSRIGSLLLIKINGDLNSAGELIDFSTTLQEKAFFSSNPKNFSIKFENNGNVHLIPYGSITISNLLGTEVDKLLIEPFFALPESTRKIEVEWNNDRKLFGYYTASLDLKRGYGDLEDSKKISFMILPLNYILIAIIFVTVLLGLYYMLAKRYVIRRK